MGKQCYAGNDGMKMSGQDFINRMDEVYKDIHRFRRDQYKSFSNQFDVPLATIINWTTRGAPSWVSPVLDLVEKQKTKI
jgi:hypothetical protein